MKETGRTRCARGTLADSTDGDEFHCHSTEQGGRPVGELLDDGLVVVREAHRCPVARDLLEERAWSWSCLGNA
jgi:hypothetical protein